MTGFDRYLIRAWVQDFAALCAVVLFAAGLVTFLDALGGTP